MSKKRKFSKGKTIFWIISLIFWILSMSALGLLTYEIVSINILPSKFYKLIILGFVILVLLFILFVRTRKTKKIILIFLDILFLILIGGCYFGYTKLYSLIDFMESNLGAKYDTNVYYLIVNNESNYKSSSDIKGMNVKLVDELNDKKTLESNFRKKISVEYEYVDSIIDYMNQIKENKDLILIVNSGNYDAMIENDNLLESEKIYSDYVKILETFEIKSRIENESTGIDVTNDPFVVYLSGIDTRSNSLPAKSGSDVNILLVVNPVTHKVLMINTPRDFYVPLSGKKGLNDKLTHAGLVGGYKLSLATIEDLYDIDINYFVRVNFNAVVNLVDAIGGITVYSDVDHKFICHTDRSCTIKPGNNNVKGKCALAFARERYAYKTGDRHRGENQEQVISKIIEKVTSSKTLLTKSDELLNSLVGTFQTNITTDEITSLVKLQLDDMPRWDISTYNVSGSDSYEFSYSYPNTELYVMVPDLKTVETAKNKLKDALKVK